VSIDLPAVAELGDPARTNPVCLYKMIDDRPFDACWQPPEDDGFDSITVPDLGEALLVYGQREPKECGWVGMVRDLTEVDLDHFTTTRASALLFVRVDGHGFALSFGDGYHRLVRAAVDRGFGLALALRVIDADAVRHIKREHLTGTGRVDTSSIPNGDALWSFGIREHSELVGHHRLARPSLLRRECAQKLRSQRFARAPFVTKFRPDIHTVKQVDHIFQTTAR